MHISNIMGFILGCLLFSLSNIVGAAPTLSAPQLVAKAEASGRIKVIVKVNASFVPESLMAAPSQVLAQRNVIGGVQAKVLSISNAGAGYVGSAKKFRTIPYMALEVDSSALNGLLRNPHILGIEEDALARPTLVESVPLIRGDETIEAGFDGSGWAIAILDTGVRNTHIDLDNGKVVSEACYSSNVSGTATSVCPDGSEGQVGTGAGIDCNASITGCDHGTHVAGIAAGTFGGVAPGADIISIQVFSRIASQADCGRDPAPCVRTYSSDVIAGLERVYDLRDTHNIAAVNMSFGGGQHSSACDSDSRKAVIDNLRSAGIATIIASGNDGYDGFVNAPACISSAITTGATLDIADQLASYSNHSTLVDILAPGSGIVSSVTTSDSDRGSKQGTSMAAPHVAGAFAAIRSLRSTATVAEIELAMVATGVSVTRAGVTKPRIDVLAASYLFNTNATSLPDLELLSLIASDTTLTPNQPLSLSATIRNIGNAASTPTTLRFYRSHNSTINATSTLLSTYPVGALSAGVMEVYVDNQLATLGTYWVGACVDTAIGERFSDNQCSDAVQITITAPDLVVQTPTIGDSTLDPSQTFSIGATTRNQGSRLSDITTLRFYRSVDSTITTSDGLMGTVSVGSLLPGATERRGDIYTAPIIPGTYWVGACVDLVSNESNTDNQCSDGVEITVAFPNTPDLIVESPMLTDIALEPGQGFIIGATTRNQGTGISDSTTLRFYRSVDSVITSSDGLMGTVSIGSLSPGETERGGALYKAPIIQGSYWVGACVDSVNGEAYTRNQCSSGVEIHVAFPNTPDLLVESPRVSYRTPETEAAFYTYATTRNRGTGTSAATTLSFYISTDSIITNSDELMTTESVDSLLPGETESSSGARQTAPLIPGTYWIGACVDAVISESNRFNQCSNGAEITVTQADVPDLIVQSLEVSNATLDADQPFTLTAIVKNQGTAFSQPTGIYYYRSTDSTISENDFDLGSRQVTSLVVGDTYMDSKSVEAPSVNGIYYFGACVRKLFNEQNIGNNCSAGEKVVVSTLSTITPDAYENDNSTASASTLVKGQSQSHSLHLAGDEDWMSFVLNSDESDFSIDIGGVLDEEITIYLYDKDLSLVELDDDSGLSSNSRLTVNTLSKGRYYLRVIESSGFKTIPSYSIVMQYGELADQGFCFPIKTKGKGTVIVCL